MIDAASRGGCAPGLRSLQSRPVAGEADVACVDHKDEPVAGNIQDSHVYLHSLRYKGRYKDTRIARVYLITLN